MTDTDVGRCGRCGAWMWAGCCLTCRPASAALLGAPAWLVGALAGFGAWWVLLLLAVVALVVLFAQRERIREWMRRRSVALQDRAHAEHRGRIPSLMADCPHVARTRIHSGPRPVDICWRCAGWHRVPGLAGARIMGRLRLADVLDRIAGPAGTRKR